MKKFNLDPDQLAVETFSVVGNAAHDGGTVFAHDTGPSCEATCPDRTCTACPLNTACVCDPARYSENSCLPACDTGWTVNGCGVSPNHTFSCYGTCGGWTCAPECTVG